MAWVAVSELWILRCLGGIVIGYLCGLFLTADLVSRAVLHKSAFEAGDGNPGMANLGHELGPKYAALILVGDCGKVVVAAILTAYLTQSTWSTSAIWAGIGATLGHNYPVWHKFRGGKGVATTCATFILAWPFAGIISCLVGLGTVVFSGYLCWGAVAIPAAYGVCSVGFLAYLVSQGSALGPTSIMIVQVIGAAVLLALMVLAHYPAIKGIKEGATPVATLAKKLRAKHR